MLPLKEVSESCHEQTLFPGMRTPDSLAVFQRLVFCWALSLQPISSFIHTLSKGIFSTSVFFPFTTCASSSSVCDKCKPGCIITAPLGRESRSLVWKSVVQNLLALRGHSPNFWFYEARQMNSELAPVLLCSSLSILPLAQRLYKEDGCPISVSKGKTIHPPVLLCYSCSQCS